MRVLPLLAAALCTLSATDAAACRVRWQAENELPRAAQDAANIFVGSVVSSQSPSNGSPLGEIAPVVILRGSSPGPFVVPDDEMIHNCSPLTRDWMAAVHEGQNVLVLTNAQDWPLVIVPYESDYGRLVRSALEGALAQ